MATCHGLLEGGQVAESCLQFLEIQNLNEETQKPDLLNLLDGNSES